jgi:hypothetical protein
VSTILRQHPRSQAEPASATPGGRVRASRRGAQRELQLQQLKELLNRHRMRHPSDVANARLLERQIAQAEHTEQSRTKPKPATQEVIPADAYIFVPGRQQQRRAARPDAELTEAK